MPTIRIPTPLARFADDQKTVTVEGNTVADAMESLVEKHTALKPHLFDDEGRMRNFVNVYLNDTDVRTLQKEATPVKGDDKLVIVPSIAGGRPPQRTNPCEHVLPRPRPTHALFLDKRRRILTGKCPQIDIGY